MSTLILNTESIIKRIEKHRFRYAKIFEGFVTPSDDENKIHFERYDCKTAEELIEELREFSESFHGKFTLVMRVHNGGTDKTISSCRWSTIPEAKEVDKTTSEKQTGITPQSLEDFKKQWAQEMAVQLKLKEYETIIKIKDVELNGFKTQGDKLAYVGLQMLNGIGFGKKMQAMNGIGDGANDNTQQPETVVIQDVEAFKKAINKLHFVLGEETLIKLANKVEPGADIIGMVKMYANS